MNRHDQAGTRTILIFGLFRSGTTVLTDLLTRRGHSVVFSEPMLMHGWRQQVGVIPATLAALGMPPASLPANKAGIKPPDWFEREVLPLLEGMRFWGFKEVHFSAAEALIRRYPPDFLLLTVRDPRDLFLSGLDLINKLLLAFAGGRRLRDEAWVYERLRNDVRVLAHLLIRHGGNLLRYEDQAENAGWPEQVSALLGEPFRLEERVALLASDGGRKLDEKHRHGSGLSRDSVFRWCRATSPSIQAIHYWLWRDLGPLYAAFGYGEAPVLAAVDRDAVAAIARPFDTDMAKMIRLPDVLARNHGQFLYALRAGRHHLAQGLPEGATVVEVDPLLPALKYLLKNAAYTAMAAPMGSPDSAQGEDHGWRQASHLVFNHVLEFRPDWPALLGAAMDAGKTILMTAFLADDMPAWWGDASPPRVDVAQLFAVVGSRPYGLRLSEAKAYGARLIMLQPVAP